LFEFSAAGVEHVRQRREEQVLPGGEVVLGRASGDPGPFGDGADRGPGRPAFGQAGHSGLQESGTGGPAALLAGFPVAAHGFRPLPTACSFSTTWADRGTAGPRS